MQWNPSDAPDLWVKMKMYEKEVRELCSRIRDGRPLVHNITNYVAMNFSANVLLALGASPLMSSEPAEMEEIASSASALVINIGCLDKEQMAAARLAVTAAGKLDVPWILDPAGVGVSRMRKDFVRDLVSRLRPAAIRGNASEILTLCGAECDASGVDSAIPGSDAVEGAKSLAATLGTIVAVSGEVDYVTDGAKVEQITGGSPLMASVTAMGCACTAVAGAALAVEEDAFAAVCPAMKLMSLAGSLAGSRFSTPGSFAAGFIDAIYEISKG